MKGFWYLATPYSKYPGGIDAAFIAACEQAAAFIRHGVAVYCPIAHTHPIAIHGNIDPYEHGIWIPIDEHMMRAAVGLIVCKMTGWDESVGIAMEINHFATAGKPIHHIEPNPDAQMVLRALIQTPQRQECEA